MLRILRQRLNLTAHSVAGGHQHLAHQLLVRPEHGETGEMEFCMVGCCLRFGALGCALREDGNTSSNSGRGSCRCSRHSPPIQLHDLISVGQNHVSLLVQAVEVAHQHPPILDVHLQAGGRRQQAVRAAAVCRMCTCARVRLRPALRCIPVHSAHPAPLVQQRSSLLHQRRALLGGGGAAGGAAGAGQGLFCDLHCVWLAKGSKLAQLRRQLRTASWSLLDELSIRSGAV